MFPAYKDVLLYVKCYHTVQNYWEYTEQHLVYTYVQSSAMVKLLH